MKKKFVRATSQKGHSKAAGEPERSSAGRIAAVDQPFSSAISVGASSFAIHSLTRA